MKKKNSLPRAQRVNKEKVQNYAVNIATLNLWCHKHIVLNGGWKYLRDNHTAKDTRVAMLGSGYTPHRRVNAAQIIENKSYIPGEESTDFNNHDSHVLGRIIGKSIWDKEIITGLASETSGVYVYKVTDKNDMLSFDSLFYALKHIRDMDASQRPQFINMSIGVDINPPWNDDVNNVITILEELSKTTRLLASSGNTRKWYDPTSNNKPLFPAKLPFVKSIGSIDNNKRISTFSAGGKVDYVQYGEDSIGFNNDGFGYSTSRGTSFSCPMHCGFEQVFTSSMLAKGMKIEDVIKNMDSLLKENNLVEDVGVPGVDSDMGAGLLRRL